jgi:hypothetical protein
MQYYAGREAVLQLGYEETHVPRRERPQVLQQTERRDNREI